MQKIHIFLTVLTVSLSLLVILLAVSLYMAATAQSAYQSSWMQQMWNGMGGMGMGNGGMMGGGSYGSAAPSFLWMIPVGLIGAFAIGLIGVAFFFAFPEIKPVTQPNETVGKGSGLVDPKEESVIMAPTVGGQPNPYESVSKTLTPEERKVLNVLTMHQGRYLQKYIRKEAGLSRLKTHRILARFAERGIVTLKQSGNTNEVFLSDWLLGSKARNST